MYLAFVARLPASDILDEGLTDTRYPDQQGDWGRADRTCGVRRHL